MAQRGRKPGSINGNGTPAYIIDLLSTELRWMRSDVIVDLVCEKRPVAADSVRRALWRLHGKGLVRQRLVEADGPNGWPVAEYYSDVWAAGNAS